MIDLQAVFLRESTRPTDARAVVTAAVTVRSGLYPVSAESDGASAPFIPTQAGVALVLARPGARVVVTMSDGSVEETTSVVSTPALLITCKAADTAAYVKVDGIRVAHTVLDGSTILCELPRVGPAATIQIVRSVRIGDGSVQIDFAFPTNGETVSGRHKLLSQFIKLLCTTPGSDAMHPKEGGGLLAIAGAAFGNPQDAVAEVMRAVTNTTRQMVVAQALSALPAEERMLSVALVDIGIDAGNTNSISLSLRVISADGVSAEFDLLAGVSNGTTFVG